MILFLLISRNHNRYRNQDGFVDSTRRVRALNRQQDQLFVSRSVKTPTRSGLLAGINRVASPSTLPTTHNNSKFSSNQENETGQNSNILEIKRKDYDKQMRLIEVFFFCFFSNRSLTFFFFFDFRPGTNDQSKTRRTRSQAFRKRYQERATNDSTFVSRSRRW